ncbi:HAMP domain-containing sensor histidine kinase [Dyadobacter sp. 676]|uniref:histidine kinase n=1 Tax=Dyadobacter sp. 676 TaxID=3088362 RepID=A0AAU8FHL3_9BACT
MNKYLPGPNNRILTRLGSLTLRLYGDPSEFSLQSRIFHFMGAITVCVMVYVLFFSIAVGMTTYALITGILLPLQLGLYYLSRVKKRTTIAVYIYSLLFHGFFVVSYRLSAGISGSTLLSFCLVFYLSLITTPRKEYLVLTILNIGLVGSLLWLEYHDPAFVIVHYADRREQFIDVASTYTINILLFLGGLGYVISNYTREKEKAEQRAALLDELHEEKSRLISVISHDYHTPLVSLGKYLDIIGNYELNADERKMLQSEMRQSIVNTQNLLMNLLDMTKFDSRLISHDHRFNVLDSVRDTLRVYGDIAKLNGLAFTIDLPENLTLTGNPQVFTIIIRNLINNAVKFTKGGGEVSVVYRRDQSDHLFCIRDSGQGISKGRRKDILETWKNPVRVLSRSGGLGLSLVKRYTDLLGGEITFASNPGTGTTFFLRFPASVQAVS